MAKPNKLNLDADEAIEMNVSNNNFEKNETRKLALFTGRYVHANKIPGVEMSFTKTYSAGNYTLDNSLIEELEKLNLPQVEIYVCVN